VQRRRPLSEPALELEDVQLRYGPVAAVRGLSLRVDRGEVVALVGPNGAGKTTTLLSIMGVVQAAQGVVRVHGRSVAGLRTEDIARTGVALVPEGRRIFADFTVEENIRLGLVARRSREGAKSDLAWVYGLFPALEEARARPAGLLSGGQQQQLAIARALVARPDLLLLDEPSFGLAPSLVDTVFDLLARIREHGVTILVVEQRAQLAVGFADRSYVLANGEPRGTLRPEDAGDTERMTAAYFGA
jgi:branched-chain amino acid transport system ATP-binding protein